MVWWRIHLTSMKMNYWHSSMHSQFYSFLRAANRFYPHFVEVFFLFFPLFLIFGRFHPIVRVLFRSCSLSLMWRWPSCTHLLSDRYEMGMVDSSMWQVLRFCIHRSIMSIWKTRMMIAMKRTTMMTVTASIPLTQPHQVMNWKRICILHITHYSMLCTHTLLPIPIPTQ